MSKFDCEGDQRPHMRGLIWSALVALLASAILLPTGPTAASTTPDTPASLTRLGGADRYETSLAAARHFVTESRRSIDTAVVVSGRSWRDAVIASGLSGRLRAPILLIRDEGLTGSAAEFLVEQGVGKVVVVGGVEAVPERARLSLQRFGDVERIASTDASATSVAVARRMGPAGVMPGRGRTVIVASGQVFADAMAAGGLSARGGYPVLLTSRGSLDKSVRSYLGGGAAEHVIVLGGEKAVSASVGAELAALGLTVTRLGGKTRLHTAEIVADFFEDDRTGETGARCSSRAVTGLANAWVPFDAMVAGPLLGQLCAPLLLTDSALISPATAQRIRASTRELIVLGGPAAVSAQALDQVSDEAAVEDVFAAAADRRAQAVTDLTDRISAGEYGIGGDGVLRGPDGFRIDLSRCPDDWSNTTGVSASEIRIGSTTSLSDSDGEYGAILTGIVNYFDWVNRHDPVAGKQINVVSSDDLGIEAAGAVASVDALISGGDVLSMLSLRSTTSLAAYDRINHQCVPQPFVLSGHPAWGDPELRPWTTGHRLSYTTEAVLWGAWIQNNLGGLLPVRVAAVVMDNNFGRTYEHAFRSWAEANPDVVSEFVAVHHYPSQIAEQQMLAVVSAEPDVYISMTAGRPCVTAIELAHSSGLTASIRSKRGALFTSSICESVDAHVRPAGAAAHGWRVVRSSFKNADDPSFAGEPFARFVNSRLRHGALDPTVSLYGTGFSLAYPYVEALRIASLLPGGLSRANLILAVRSLDLDHPMVFSGIHYRLSGTLDAYPVEAAQIGHYDSAAATWRVTEPIIDVDGQTPNCNWTSSLLSGTTPRCGTVSLDRLVVLAARGQADHKGPSYASATVYASETLGPQNQIRPGVWNATQNSLCIYWDSVSGAWRVDSQPGSGYVSVNGSAVRFDQTTRVRVSHGDTLTLTTWSGGRIGAASCELRWEAESD